MPAPHDPVQGVRQKRSLETVRAVPGNGRVSRDPPSAPAGRPARAAIEASPSPARGEQRRGQRPLARVDQGDEFLRALHRPEDVESCFQRALHLGQPCRSRRAAHQAQRVAQHRQARDPVELRGDPQRQLDLALPVGRAADALPGPDVVERRDRPVGQVQRGRGVERLGQRVQLGQDRDGLGDLVREQPRDRRRDAGELGVARREVAGAVELGEEIARRGAVARAREQVGIRVREASLLERLQLGHPREQARQLGAALSLRVDDAQVSGDPGGRARTSAAEPVALPTADRIGAQVFAARPSRSMSALSLAKVSRAHCA